MAAIEYAQICESGYDSRSSDDDWRIATAPADILSGQWILHYKPIDDDTFAADRYLLSVDSPDGELAIYLKLVAGLTYIAVTVGGVDMIVPKQLDFAAMQHLKFTINSQPSFSGIDIVGSTSHDGSFTGSAWGTMRTGPLRLGGDVLGTSLANGYVSLPYAVGSQQSVGGGGGGGGS